MFSNIQTLFLVTALLTFASCGGSEEESSDLSGRRGSGHHQIEDWNAWENGYELIGRLGKNNKQKRFRSVACPARSTLPALSCSDKFVVYGPYKSIPSAKSGRVLAFVELSAEAYTHPLPVPGTIILPIPPGTEVPPEKIPIGAEIYVDFTTNSGRKVIDSKILRFTGKLARKVITFDVLNFTGPLVDAEVRVGRIKVHNNGGNAYVKIYKTELDYSWK